MNSFGKKLTDLRKQAGFSQQQVAQKLATSGAIVGRYERGEMKPSIEVAAKLAKIFNVTLDYLVDDSNSLSMIRNSDMLKRFEEIEKMPDTDKQHILYTIDALIRDAHTRNTYAS